MILTSVDLPAPLSPTSATTSPARTSRLNLSIATSPPKVLWMSSRARTGGASISVSLMARSRPIGGTAEGVVDRFDSRRAARNPGDPDDIGSGHEGLRTESKDHAVADFRPLRAAGVDHAVIVDGGRRRNLDLSQRADGRSRLARHDGPHLIVGEDRIDIKAAAEAIGFAANMMGDLAQIDDGRPLGEVLDRMQRRRAGEAVAWLDLRRARLGEQR